MASGSPPNAGESRGGLDSQTTGLLINLGIGAVIIVVCLIVFDILRRKVPSVFEARRLLNFKRLNLDYSGNRVYSPPPPSHRMFGWVLPVARLELDTVAVTHGRDIALYLRYLRTMAFLFLVLCITAIVLLPVYYTGTRNEDLADQRDRITGIDLFSMSNVDPEDPWRFFITLAVEYVMLFFILFLLKKEFSEYTNQRRRYRSTDNPANYSIIVEAIPVDKCSVEDVTAYWDRLFPGKVQEVTFIHNGAYLEKQKNKFWTAVSNREKAEWNMAFNPKLAGSRPRHKVGSLTCCKGESAAVDSIDHWQRLQDHYAEKIEKLQRDIDTKKTPPTRAAIVVFDSKRAASEAAQTNFAVHEKEWRVLRAPEPKGINWKAFVIPLWQEPGRQVLTILFSVLLTLFWIIPVTFIMSIVNLEALAELKIDGKEPFSFLGSVANWSPLVTGLIQSILPAVILSVFLSLIPTFLRIFINISRNPSNPTVDNLVRDWYFNFVIFSNFLFVVVSGSLLDRLSEIVGEPSKIVEFLASSAPKNAAFMMNFILLKAVSGSPLEILQLGRVILRWVKLRLTKLPISAKTAREKNTADIGTTGFQFFRYYAFAQLVAVLGLIYSTIAPFIIPICFLYFAITYIVAKYNLCYSMHNIYDDGGSMYGGALYGTLVGLFLHLLTFIGIVGLNKEPIQSALAIIPAVICVAFFLYARRSYTRICRHGSASETQLRIEEDTGVDKVPATLSTKYIHPGFDPLPDPIENLSGVDDENKLTPEADDLENPSTMVDEITPTPPLATADPDVESPAPPAGDSEDWKDALPPR